jgi:glycosyltransferase involved in cell wall biosynthesis
MCLTRTVSDITVIMTAYNEARFIHDAVQSVQDQTYQPAELLLIDNGSTDDTVAIAQSVGGAVPVRVLSNTQMPSVVAARNLGLREAGSEWIATLDADDVWMPEKLERQRQFIESWTGHWPIAVLGVKGRHINEAGKDVGMFDLGVTTAEAYWALVESDNVAIIGHSAALFRRDAALTVGGYREESLGAEDVELWDRIAWSLGGVVIDVDQRLLLYRKKRGGMMHTLFTPQMLNIERIQVNRRRRNDDLPELSLAEFQNTLQLQPLRVRATRRRKWAAAKYYRFGAVNFVNSARMLGASQLAMATLLDPKRVVAGVRRRLTR